MNGLGFGLCRSWSQSMTVSRVSRVVVLVAAALALLAGVASPASAATRFVDVRSSGWEVEPISWFDQQGITKGCGTDRFCPNAPMTRAQQITFLHRYAGEPASSGETPFIDMPGNYADEAIRWAYNTGVTTGCGDGSTFCPNDGVTRAQAVTFLWRQAGEPTPSGPNNFGDVEDGRWFTDPIRWAAQTGVTTGCGDGSTFCPDAAVTRAEFATFLYRFDDGGHGIGAAVGTSSDEVRPVAEAWAEDAGILDAG